MHGFSLLSRDLIHATGRNIRPQRPFSVIYCGCSQFVRPAAASISIYLRPDCGRPHKVAAEFGSCALWTVLHGSVRLSDGTSRLRDGFLRFFDGTSQLCTTYRTALCGSEMAPCGFRTVPHGSVWLSKETSRF